MDLYQEEIILRGQFPIDVNDYKRLYEVRLFNSGVQFYPISQGRSSTISRGRSRDEESTSDLQTSVNSRRASSKVSDSEADILIESRKNEVQFEQNCSVSNQKPSDFTNNRVSDTEPISPDVFHDSKLQSPTSSHESNPLAEHNHRTTQNSSSKKKSVTFLHVSSILGCDCQKGKVSSDTAVYFVIYAYVVPSKDRKPSDGKEPIPLCRKRETLTVKFDGGSGTTYEENYKEAARWMVVLTNILRGTMIQSYTDLATLAMPIPMKLLVLLNPFSGPGDALTIYQKRVVPMFAQARIDYHLIVTERAGHARELVKQINLDEWQGIVIVSGDGLIFEVVNGLMERPDWEKGIKIPLGAIPGGSGNALACAISYHAGEPYLEKHAMHASFIVSKHDVVPMDLVAVDMSNGDRLYSFLSVGWGMIADVDIESEKYRNMGNARFAFMAVIKIASMKKYRGRLSFLPADDNYIPRKGSVSKESYIPRKNSATDVENDESDKTNSVHGKHSQVIGDSSLNYKSILSPLLPPLDQPVPAGWVTIEDDFILVGGIYQSHLAKDNLMTPNATLDDGLIHLVFVRGDCSRVNLIRLFVALEGGLEVRDDDYSTEVVKVLAFRLEPHGTKGLMTVDGERVDYGPIQAQVLPSMARVMSIKH